MTKKQEKKYLFFEMDKTGTSLKIAKKVPDISTKTKKACLPN